MSKAHDKLRLTKPFLPMFEKENRYRTVENTTYD